MAFINWRNYSKIYFKVYMDTVIAQSFNFIETSLLLYRYTKYDLKCEEKHMSAFKNEFPENHCDCAYPRYSIFKGVL